MPKLIDYAQIQKIYGLKKSTMSKLVMHGKFVQPVKIGVKNFFKTEDVEQWIETQTVKA